MISRLAIITTHPIQYNAPLFALLASRKVVDVKVFYTWGESVLDNKFDPGFGKQVKWDIPLLDGYEYEFVENRSADPGSHHFKGIDNPGLVQRIHAWNADGLLVFGWAFAGHLKVLRYFHGKIPVLFKGDSTLLRKQAGVRIFLRNLFLTWIYRHIDYALYVGTENRLYFKKFGLTDKQFVYAPHAIDNQRFADTNGQHEAAAMRWKQELGIDNNELVIVYAGKLEAIKQPELIIELGKKFNGSRVRFILVGNGPLEAALKAASANDSRFIFLDFQNQQRMPVIYRLGDLFILSSVSETWGLAINEAMAAAKGVLVRDTCGCAPDLVEAGVNGFIYSGHNLDHLFDKLTLLTEDKETVKKMGAASLQKIQSFTFAHIAAAIESIALMPFTAKK